MELHKLSSEPTKDSILQSALSPILAIYLKKTKEVMNQFPNIPWVFLSREGKLLKKLVDRAIKCETLPRTSTAYLEVSRRSLAYGLVSAGKLNADLVAYEHFYGNKLQLWHGRFGVPIEVIEEIMPLKNQKQTMQPGDQWAIVTEMREANQIIPTLKTNAYEITQDYLSEILGAKKESRILSDIGYRGTMQKMIENLLDRKFAGVYVATKVHAQRNLEMYSATRELLEDLILKNTHLFESMFDLGDPSVIGYKKMGDSREICYEESTRTPSVFYGLHLAAIDEALGLSREQTELLEFIFRFNFPERILHHKHLSNSLIRNEKIGDTWSGTN